MATLNTGLDPERVPYAMARRAVTAQALMMSRHEVVCLQEVWPESDGEGGWSDAPLEELAASIAPTYPTTKDTLGAFDPEPPACNRDDIQPVLDCATSNCNRSLGDAAFAACIADRCRSDIAAVPADCWSCAVRNLDAFSQLLEECAPEPVAPNAEGFAFGGRTGLMVASRQPLTVAGQLQLPGAALVRRAALHARIIDPEQGPINIYCTQLTRDPGPEVTYPADGPFDSFAQEHEAQMEALLEYIESTRAGAPVVVLGDLGSGPDIGNNTGAFQGTFDRLLSEGQLKSPYLEASEPLCTVCVDNPLGSWTQDQVLDHSLVRDRELLDAARAFDGLWTVTTEDEGELLVPLSDRYGVSVRFR